MRSLASPSDILNSTSATPIGVTTRVTPVSVRRGTSRKRVSSDQGRRSSMTFVRYLLPERRGTQSQYSLRGRAVSDLWYRPGGDSLTHAFSDSRFFGGVSRVKGNPTNENIEITRLPWLNPRQDSYRKRGSTVISAVEVGRGGSLQCSPLPEGASS